MKPLRDMTQQEIEDNIVQLIQEGKEKELDLEDALHDICQEVHSHCNPSCPVYRLNHNSVPNTLNRPSGCDCFKSGLGMRTFIKDPTRDLPK